VKFGYVPALDGLRGVAIALVVGQHLWHFPAGGNLGVDLFFALSGFLITTLLLEELAETGRVSVRAFYARRSRRLLPALAVLLIVYLVLGGGVSDVALGGLYIGNFVQAFAHPNPLLGGGLDHLWSLAEEEQFYLLWPMILLAITGVRRPLMVGGLLVAALLAYRTGFVIAGAHGPRVYYGPDMHADGLLGGSVLALLRMRQPLSVPEPLVVTAMVTLFFGAFFAEAFAPNSTQYALPVFEFAAVVMVAAAATKTPLAEALAARPLVSLGKISYSLYLWHVVILWAFHRQHTLAVLAVSLLAASCSYWFVERPFRRHRRSRVERPALALGASASS
jgi:peptidoglycan/LPS O-acetylase OafA/YrhL